MEALKYALPYPNCPNGYCSSYALANLFRDAAFLDMQKKPLADIGDIQAWTQQYDGLNNKPVGLFWDAIAANHNGITMAQCLDAVRYYIKNFNLQSSKEDYAVPLLLETRLKDGRYHSLAAYMCVDGSYTLLIDPAKQYYTFCPLDSADKLVDPSNTMKGLKRAYVLCGKDNGVTVILGMDKKQLYDLWI